jgi:hypothetical protein
VVVLVIDSGLIEQENEKEKPANDPNGRENSTKGKSFAPIGVIRGQQHNRGNDSGYNFSLVTDSLSAAQSDAPAWSAVAACRRPRRASSAAATTNH